ncbi:hypothetical protein GCM10023191_058070 [Actinoallomurus oryzae]|uniref:EamA domain-containing protein n=1 Tax=Actinoallomurus oryzae TaxID=502180 RepID=A0ABP8QKT4_9ACTN
METLTGFQLAGVAVIGAVFFRERMGLPRFAAAGIVVGVALINVH